MKIGILGTGAMGSLFAAKLAPHAEIVVLGTWLEGVRALQTRGVRLNSGGIETTVPVRALADPREAPKMDLVLVLVKGYQTQRAAQWARTILKTDGIALTLQNGLGNFEIIGAEVGINRAAVGVSMQGATLIKPGYVYHAGSGPTTIAYKPETHERLSNAAALFNSAGIETLLTDDLRALIWGKLVVNSAINALTAILQVPNGWLVRNQDAQTLMADAARETANVAAAIGIELPFDDPAARALQVAKATGANRSSTLQDVLRGAPTELEMINGAVVREGARQGVPTPVNSALLRIFQAQDQARRSHSELMLAA